MELTVQELAALDPKGYVLLDMRGSEAREYGSIPWLRWSFSGGAVPV